MADTLEDLRRHVEDLIRRLSEAPEDPSQTVGVPGQTPASDASMLELDAQISALSTKVDRAGNMLAQVTDLLEAQTERIETLEEQFDEGDMPLDDDLHWQDDDGYDEDLEAPRPDPFVTAPPAPERQPAAPVAPPSPVSAAAPALQVDVSGLISDLSAGVAGTLERELAPIVETVRHAAQVNDPDLTAAAVSARVSEATDSLRNGWLEDLAVVANEVRAAREQADGMAAELARANTRLEELAATLDRTVGTLAEQQARTYSEIEAAEKRITAQLLERIEALAAEQRTNGDALLAAGADGRNAVEQIVQAAKLEMRAAMAAESETIGSDLRARIARIETVLDDQALAFARLEAKGGEPVPGLSAISIALEDVRRDLARLSREVADVARAQVQPVASAMPAQPIVQPVPQVFAQPARPVADAPADAGGAQPGAVRSGAQSATAAVVASGWNDTPARPADVPLYSSPEPEPGPVFEPDEPEISFDPADVLEESADESPEAPEYEPMDAATARKLEELVEREVRLQQEFGPGAADARSAHGAEARTTPVVMVVDDLPDARKILSIYLCKRGYQVVTASGGEDCLAKLRRHHVDAVVLDANMPGAGAREICATIRGGAQFGEKSAVPIVVYTAYAGDFPREQALEWGADDFIVKGGDIEPLVSALVRHTKPEQESTS